VGPGPAWQRARAKLRGWRAAAKSAIRRVVSEVVDKVKKRGWLAIKEQPWGSPELLIPNTTTTAISSSPTPPPPQPQSKAHKHNTVSGEV